MGSGPLPRYADRLRRIVNDIPIGTCTSPPPPPNRRLNVTQLFNIVVPNAGGSGSTTFDIKTITIRRDCQQGIMVNITNTGAQDQTFSLGTVNSDQMTRPRDSPGF